MLSVAVLEFSLGSLGRYLKKGTFELVLTGRGNGQDKREHGSAHRLEG